MDFTRKNLILVSFLLLLLCLVVAGGISFPEWIPVGEISEAGSSSWGKKTTPFQSLEFFKLSASNSNLSKNLDGPMGCEVKNFKIENCLDQHYSSMTGCELKACYYFVYSQQDAIHGQESGSQPIHVLESVRARENGFRRRRKEHKRDLISEGKASRTMDNISSTHAFDDAVSHTRQPGDRKLINQIENASNSQFVGFTCRTQPGDRKLINQIIVGDAGSPLRRPKSKKGTYTKPFNSLKFICVGFFLFVGLVIWGLVLVSARDSRLHNPPSQQAGINVSSTAPVQTSCKFYVYGALCSALAVVIFFIHFCIRSWHKTGQ